MGMDMMYIEEEIRESRCKQAHITLEEISKLIDKHYNKESREDLKREIRKLEHENLRLSKELAEYKEIVNKIELLQGKKED